MSGDYDTALGNTLLNHYILSVVFRNVKHHILLDGDDSVIVMEKHQLHLLDFSEFDKLGMTTTYEVVHELDQVEFCRSKLIGLDDVPRFARDWRRATANMGVTVRNYPDKESWLRYFAGVGMGELAASNGVPIIGPLAVHLSKLHGKPIMLDEYKFKGAFTSWAPITDEVRDAYYKQWDVSPEMQLHYENELCNPEMLSYLLGTQSEFKDYLQNKDVYHCLP